MNAKLLGSLVVAAIATFLFKARFIEFDRLLSDSFVLDVRPPLDPAKASLEVEVEGQERYVVVGSGAKEFARSYGRHNFTLVYDGQLVGSVHQFKDNWWHVHKYSVVVKLVGGEPAVSWNTVGPNGLY